MSDHMEDAIEEMHGWNNDRPRLSEADRLLTEVAAELARAEAKFTPFNSAHEGYAVILEEVEELWLDVRTKGTSLEKMRAEAVQIAAMGVRFMKFCDSKRKP